MIAQLYPIIGSIRLSLLILEWAYAIIIAELALISILKLRNRKNKTLFSEEFGFFCLFLGIAIFWFMKIIADYFVYDTIFSPILYPLSGYNRVYLTNIGYTFFILFSLVFSFIMEKRVIMIWRRYLISSLYSLFFIIFMILFYIDLNISKIYAGIAWVFIILNGLGFLLKSRLIFMDDLENQKDFILIFIIFLFAFLGSVLSVDILLINNLLYLRLLGSILQLTAIIIIFRYYMKLPSFSELNWRESIKEIYILNNNGACLYYKFLDKEEKALNSHLITGAISSVKIMLTEITKSKPQGYSIIEKENNYVNIFTSQLVTGVIISDTDLNIISKNLQDLVIKIEKIYNPKLQSWDGNTEIFFPIEYIIQNLFL